MTKVKMPDPVAHMTQSGSRVLTDREARSMQVAGWDRNKHLEYYSVPLISVANAEAYANARVRVALEEAATVCWEMQSNPEYGKDDKDRWLAIAEQRIRA